MKWATAAVLALMVILFMAAANEAYGAVTKPVPPGYRCAPKAYLKCYAPGTAPRPPAAPAPTRPVGGAR